MSLRFSICRRYLFLLITVFLTLWLPANAQLFNPSDPQATNETRQLYHSMQRLKGAGTIFGHHDDTAYGVGWCFVKDQSDVKSVTGTYPAIYGWDLAKIEHDSVRDINGVPFKYQKQLVQEAYRRGGINTFCWHMDNPANGKTAWDTSMRTVATILPGGEHHETYKQWLDKAAAYMANLNGDDGEQIPILFRPFHELTGNWFWWCANTSTPEEFKQLWRFTIDYLRQTRKLHNLLIIFSEADFNSEEEFMQRYPGNGYVDFIGFDNYCYKNVEDYKYNLNKRLDIIDGIAKRNNKLTCLPETGYEQIPQANWWTTVLQPILANHQPSYAMVWRNGRPDHYYAPYPGQISEADFKKFFASPQVIFENRIAPLGVYGKYVLKK